MRWLVETQARTCTKQHESDESLKLIPPPFLVLRCVAIGGVRTYVSSNPQNATINSAFAIRAIRMHVGDAPVPICSNVKTVRFCRLRTREVGRYIRWRG